MFQCIPDYGFNGTGKRECAVYYHCAGRNGYKKPLYAEGRRKLGKLWENNCYLQRHGVRMIEGSLVDGTFVMPFVDGMSMVKHFRQLMAENKMNFFASSIACGT